MSKNNFYTSTIVDHVVNLQFNDVPSTDVYKTKQLIVDYLATTLYSRGEAPAEILLDVCSSLEGKEEAQIIGYDRKMSVLSASLINGAMGHMTELDDTHRGTMSHPGDSIIAASLAMAERCNSTGKEVLTAIISGYEVAIRVGESVMPSHYRKGWHPSGTVNTFGATVAAGKLLQLSSIQMANALGIAGTQVSGSFAHVPERGMVKDFNTGQAAFKGVLSALLAQKDFTGATNIFENKSGFSNLYSDEHDLNKLVENLGNSYKVMEVAHKVYTSCRHIHSAIDASLKLREKIKPSQVEKISLRIFSTGAVLVDDPKPWEGNKGLYGSRFSAQFNVAVAFLYGKEGIMELYEKEKVEKLMKSTEIRSFMEKIVHVPDDELDKEFPDKWATIVEVIKKDNEELECRVDYPKGEPENKISNEFLLEKSYKLLSGLEISKRNTEKMIDIVYSLDKEDNIGHLMGLLALGNN